MTQSEVMATLLEISENSYYRWKKKDHVRLVNLIEKYFTIKDLEEFLETEKISRLENNRDQELLNNEASKIYNHFISVLYLKDKSLLRLFLVVINNANETSANLNLNFIDLVFESEGSKKDKINLLKEFNKTVQNNNILFFYSIKYMFLNNFETISYSSNSYEDLEYYNYSFNITYFQLILEIFYKKKYMNLEEHLEFKKHIINNKSQSIKKPTSKEDYVYILNEDEPYPISIFEQEDDYIKLIDEEELSDLEALFEYIKYLKSLILEEKSIKIDFEITPNEFDINKIIPKN
ncbi:hypothetical protein N5T98_07295 [Aliarcobacter cryaerophilus]|uniref:hypothetical protein n=1 Tax=Aliarcobacter cryaerophilus TaxID=28198 RepID=UPI0021B56406|nr:hypothetical protein [Aliarcobacter cryaerophilus]MCT7486547.1 hypothetical protein [Aliarcobacter cryaerophilus]MCT7490894.1 hypothetical protein [Aliarcobacter cryaerophilus]